MRQMSWSSKRPFTGQNGQLLWGCSNIMSVIDLFVIGNAVAKNK